MGKSRKRKGGRPTKRTPDARRTILRVLAEGNTRGHACVYAGISEDTFANWMKEDSGFSEAVKKADATAILRNVKIIQKAAKTTWTAAAWWLERRFPSDYGKRMEHSGPGGGPIPHRMDLSRLSDEELSMFRIMLAKLEGKA